MQAVNTSYRILSVTLNVLLAIVLSSIALLVYWTLEPDPLTVKQYGKGYAECVDRKFSFERYVRTSKSLDIYVQQRWYNKDGIDDLGNIHKETVITVPDYYPLGKDFEKIMEFNKCVPDNIPIGRYEYRPWITYKINPIKIVHRLAPVQEVNVVCDFDPSKHKSCDPNRRGK
jgi:hypothetical protein